MKPEIFICKRYRPCGIPSGHSRYGLLTTAALDLLRRNIISWTAAVRLSTVTVTSQGVYEPDWDRGGDAAR